MRLFNKDIKSIFKIRKSTPRQVKRDFERKAKPLITEDTSFLNSYKIDWNHRSPKSFLDIKVDFLDIVGSGKTQREAYENVFEKLKTQIYRKHNSFIVQLETLDVIKLKDAKDENPKKLFGFWPLHRQNWEVSLRVIYRLKFISGVK